MPETPARRPRGAARLAARAAGGLQQSLEAVVPGADRGGPDTEAGLVGPGLVHSFGLDVAAMSIAWCDSALAQLDHEDSR